MLIIPAINAQTFEEAQAQLKKIESIFSGDTNKEERWIHLDIVDGTFAPNTTWGNPEEFKNLKSQISNLKINFEIHLMVQGPEFVVAEWLKAGAKRVIVHVEAMSDSEIITDACKEHSAEAMLAAGPETSIEQLVAHANEFTMFQLLAVQPGKAGQTYDMRVTEKIRALRAKVPRATIEVDGGMNAETAELVKEVGANSIVSASYILESSDPEEAYKELASL